MAAKTERAAVNSFYIAGFGYFVFAMIPVMLGIIGSVTIPDLANSESVIPALAMKHLHPVAVAVFVGAILAAVMSTCDSALLAAASISSRNILPMITRNPTDELTLKVTRYAIPGFGVLAVLIALNSGDIYDLIVDANVLALTSTIVPFLLMVWWKKANRTGAVSAMATGFLTWLVSRSIAPELPADLIGMGVCLLTIVVVSLLTQEFDPPRPARDVDGNEVELDDRLGILLKRP